MQYCKYYNRVFAIIICLLFFSKLHSQSVPTSGLVAWYPFNGNANDGGPNANNGTVNGAILTTDRNGNANSAYYFSSVNCGTWIGANINTASINGDLTLSFWVSRSGAGCIGPRIMEFGSADADDGFMQIIWDNGTPKIFMHHNSGGISHKAEDFVNTLNDNQWYHIVYTHNGTVAKFYVNGLLVNTANRSGIVHLNGNVAFGRMNHSAWDAFNGKLDDIGIWNRILTQSDISNLYNDCSPPIVSSTTPLSKCDAGIFTLEATPSAGVINWYISSTGGSSLQTGTSFTTPSINATTTYYVDATNNGCTSSSRTAVVATVNTTPTVSGTTPLTRCDAGAIALGASASSGTINWYGSSTGGSSLQTGNSFTTPSINTTTTYYVDATSNGCTSSSRTAVVATVNTTPTVSGTTPLSRCDAGAIALGASASSGTINWYGSSTGGSSLQTANSFTTPSINTTTTYYVDATNNGCTSSSRTAVVATVNTTPTVSGTTPLSRCDAGTIALGASASSGTINWYGSSTGGSSLQTGTSFTTPSINATTTYYVDATNNGCTSSSRTAIVATVNTTPTVSSTTPLSRCDAGTVALGASASNGTINWYGSSTGGSSLQTGNSFTTPSINTTMTYYVDATNNGCTSSSRTAIVATVNTTPTVSSTTPLSRCDAGTVALGAIASSGTINWYGSSTGGSSLQTGNSFTTPSINTTMTYYVDATNNGCTSSSRTGVEATVNASPTIIGTTPLSRCDGGTVALGASASSGNINWYGSSAGGSSLQTGNSFTTPSINTTTTYYVDATNNGCTSSSRTAVVATVNTIPTKPAISWDGIQFSTTSSLTSVNYQWLFNNSSIASATSSIYKPTEIGNYNIQVTDANGCKNESESFMLSVKADDNLVKIFPNPASKYVMVYLSQKPTQSLTMKLFSLQGQELKQVIINNQITNISLREILVGNYIIKIFGKDFSQTKKLLIVQ